MSTIYTGIMTGLVVIGITVALTVRPSPEVQATMAAHGVVVALLEGDRVEAMGEGEEADGDCHCTDTEVGCTDDCLDSAEVEAITDNYLREGYPQQ